MREFFYTIALIIIFVTGNLCLVAAAEKNLEQVRVGGGLVGAPQMTLWFAKEANL